MSIEITVRLDDDIVKNAVNKAWTRAFSIPDPYGRSSNDTEVGWQEVKRQVAEHVKTLDLSEMIADSARRQLAGVVDEAVTAALRDAAKKKAKEMRVNGTLLLLEES